MTKRELEALAEDWAAKCEQFAARAAALERERDEARAAHDRCFHDSVALQRENERLGAALEPLARLGQAMTKLKQQPIDAVRNDDGFTSITMPSEVADELYTLATSADALKAQLYANERT